LFYALDMTLAAFALGLADVVRSDDERRFAGDRGVYDSALRDASRELERLPLTVAVDTTVSAHDVFVAVDDGLADLVVIDNYGLLLPTGLASDLKHLAIEASVAVLTSTTLAVTEPGAGVAMATADLLSAADAIVTHDRDVAGADRSQIMVAKPDPRSAPSRESDGVPPALTT
jgi:hypothetical protein